MASTDRQNTILTVDLSPTMVRFESKDRSEVKEEDYKPYVDAISTYLTIQPGTLIRILACNKSYNQLGISFQFDEEHKNIIGIALKWPDAIYQLRLNIQSAVDKRMYEAAFRNTETVQYEFQANSNSLRRALSVMNAGAQKVDTVKVSFEGQMMSISDMKNDNFVSAIDVKTTAESGECFYEKLSLFMNFLKPYTEDVKIYKGWCIWTKDDENQFHSSGNAAYRTGQSVDKRGRRSGRGNTGRRNGRKFRRRFQQVICLFMGKLLHLRQFPMNFWLFCIYPVSQPS